MTYLLLLVLLLLIMLLQIKYILCQHYCFTKTKEICKCCGRTHLAL